MWKGATVVRIALSGAEYLGVGHRWFKLERVPNDEGIPVAIARRRVPRFDGAVARVAVRAVGTSLVTLRIADAMSKEDRRGFLIVASEHADAFRGLYPCMYNPEDEDSVRSMLRGTWKPPTVLASTLEGSLDSVQHIPSARQFHVWLSAQVRNGADVEACFYPMSISLATWRRMRNGEQSPLVEFALDGPVVTFIAPESVRGGTVLFAHVSGFAAVHASEMKRFVTKEPSPWAVGAVHLDDFPETYIIMDPTLTHYALLPAHAEGNLALRVAGEGSTKYLVVRATREISAGESLRWRKISSSC
jgi:hypothetical protein